MKHIKSYKIFESFQTYDKQVDLISTINDIVLDLTDEGYEAISGLVPTKKTIKSSWLLSKDEKNIVPKNSIKIKVTSPRKESLYSKWRQDRENYAKKEYEKCKSTLDRLDEFLKSNGLEVINKNGIGKNLSGNFMASYGTRESSQLDYGVCNQGYDSTGQWTYEIVYTT